MFTEISDRRVTVVAYGSGEELANRVARVLPDCRVEAVESDHQCFAAAQHSDCDLVLLGKCFSGSEAVKRLQRLRSTRPAIKVILNPGHGTREDVIAAVRAGAFSYFSRPFLDPAFNEILRHAAGGGEWQDSIRVDSATPTWLRVIARCDVPTADRVLQFINEVSDLTGKDRDSMGFAFKEILMNAMEYGGSFSRERLVEVSCVRASRMIIYRIRDPGEGFSLDHLDHAAISNPPEEPVRHLQAREAMGIRPGGFGVLLARKLVDDLIYSEQGNDVLLVKYLENEGGPDPAVP